MMEADSWKQDLVALAEFDGVAKGLRKAARLLRRLHAGEKQETIFTD